MSKEFVVNDRMDLQQANVRRREEALVIFVLRAVAGLLLLVPFALIGAVAHEGLQLFGADGISPQLFLFTTTFDPAHGQPGIAALLVGSSVVMILAVAIATTCGLATAIFLVDIASPAVARVGRTAIDILAGIPSVVFGWFGAVTVVPYLAGLTHTRGFGIAAAASVVAFMILPTLVSLTVSALVAVAPELREGSQALGATRWETIRYVVLPAARDGLLAAMLLAVTRAIGESVAVQMLIGNVAEIPRDVLSPGATLATALISGLPQAAHIPPWEHALFAIALVLLAISVLCVTGVRILQRSVKLV